MLICGHCGLDTSSSDYRKCKRIYELTGVCGCSQPDCPYGEPMTNQQKYVELKEKHSELGLRIDGIHDERVEISNQMDTIAETFSDTFFYKVKGKLLYRTNGMIELKEFTK